MHVSYECFVVLFYYLYVILIGTLLLKRFYFYSVSDVVKLAAKTDIPPHKKMLELVPSFSEDEDCPTVPFIRYLL